MTFPNENKHQQCNETIETEEQLRQLAATYQQQGEIEKTITVLQKLLALTPQDIATLGNLGLMYHTSGNQKTAAEYYRKAITLGPKLYHLHYLLGTASREMGLFSQATKSLQEAARLEPSAINVLQELATTHFQQDRTEDAEKCLYSILEQDPHHGWALSNLGLLFFRQQRFDQALIFYKKALDQNNNDGDLLYNLGLTHRRLGNAAEAMACYKKALTIIPEDAEIYFNLGILYKECNDFEKAINCFKRTVTLDPNHGDALHNLGNLYHLSNEIDNAIACYEKAVELDHHAAVAGHLLDSMTGGKREIAPPQYVTDIFDNYAERFDHSLLNELGYKVPELLRKLLNMQLDDGQIFPHVLDLGCGTGLSGLALQERVGHLTGVDLSNKMLAQAQAKGIYHALHCGDLVHFLNHATTKRYDLVIAADVFTYIGNLAPLFCALTDRLSPNAVLLFSTEHHDDNREYILKQSGRFGHGVGYINDLASTHKFTVSQHKETDIRQDKGKWLRGDLYLLTLDEKMV